jgi:hypothetical protein
MTMFLELNGEVLPIGQWARITGFPYQVIYDRKLKGWSDRDALTKEPKKMKNKADNGTARDREAFQGLKIGQLKQLLKWERLYGGEYVSKIEQILKRKS